MSDPTVVIDYGAGNLRSVARALTAAGARDVQVTSDPDVIARAARIVLPGVGAFAQCITALRGAAGIEPALTQAVQARGVPFLGICVGMQLLAREGHEHGVHAGLGWLPGVVTRLAPADPALKIPHMGWNQVTPANDSAVAAGDAYFVHSYRFDPSNVAEPMCGTSTTLGRSSNSGWILGSCSNTSSPAPAMPRRLSAAASAASSTISPRAVLMR